MRVINLVVRRGEALVGAGYPAEHYRLVELDFRLETPIDGRGLIDTTQHVDLVKQTLSSRIDWKNHATNMHHFYWPARDYADTSEDPTSLESTFRNLPIHKGIMPVQFHNWLHRISEPPELPSKEVMEYRVEAWGVAARLFDAVRSYKRKTRSLTEFFLQDQAKSSIEELSDVDREVLDDLYSEFFETYPTLHQKLYEVPGEFQLVDPDQPFELINKQLGKIAGASTLHFTRHISLAA